MHNPGPDGQDDPIYAMGVAVSTDPQPSTQGSAAAPDPQLDAPPEQPAPVAPPEQPAPAAPPLPPQHKIRPTRLSGLWFAVVFFAVVLLFLLIFILQNGRAVDVSYLGAHGHLPLGVAMLFSAVCGVLLTILAGAAPDDIIVVSGVAQALALLAQWLTARGHTRIAVEDPGSLGSREELAYWGLTAAPVPVDEHGLQTAHLAGSGLRAALLTPAHQFPTGVVLAPQRRRELLDWAVAADALIVEDDYDAEYRYDRAPVPALQTAAPGHVAYAGTTSKTLAPGMRLGWLVPPARLHADLVEAKHAADLGSPALPQLVLARLIATGELEQHIRTVRKRQRSRRDALLGALREHLPEARVQGIPAGLHLLIRFPALTLDDRDLAERIHRSGVLVHPLSWHRQRPGPPGLVLGYAAHTPDQLREAARRIARAVTG